MKTEIALTAAAGLVSWIAWQIWRVSTIAFESELSCQCGKVNGHVKACSGLHIVCYCDDCQSFAEHTNRSILDEAGGTDIVQVFPSEVKFTQGKEHLKIGKLKEESKLLRAYASCCGTPLFNTMENAPFLGLLTSCLKTTNGIGPVEFRIMGKFAKSPQKDTSHIVPVSFVLAFFGRTLLLHRNKAQPSPIDSTTPTSVFK